MTFELDEEIKLYRERRIEHYQSHLEPSVTCFNHYPPERFEIKEILPGNTWHCNSCNHIVQLRDPEVNVDMVNRGTLRLIRELFLKREEEF